MSEVIEIHKDITEKHYSNFLEYYEKKNFPKASEFLWGTLNSLFYAIGDTYGITLSNYSSIKKFTLKLAVDYDLEKIKDQYSAAETLHANFYHNFMSEDLFEHNKEKVVELIQNLLEILELRIRLMSELV